MNTIASAQSLDRFQMIVVVRIVTRRDQFCRLTGRRINRPDHTARYRGQGWSKLPRPHRLDGVASGNPGRTGSPDWALRTLRAFTTTTGHKRCTVLGEQQQFGFFSIALFAPPKDMGVDCVFGHSNTSFQHLQLRITRMPPCLLGVEAIFVLRKTAPDIVFTTLNYPSRC